MITKTCTMCNTEKGITDYYKKASGAYGVQSECKDCNKARVKKNYSENREARVEQKRIYFSNNREKVLVGLKNYYYSNREKELERKKDYALRNKDIIRKRGREYEKKISKDPLYRIKQNTKDRIRKVCGGIDLPKSKIKYIGCSGSELRSYLESKFYDNISWDNYGKVWHVDHKIPVSWFDLSIEEERCKAFHYTNLQPLLALENISKGNRYAHV